MAGLLSLLDLGAGALQAQQSGVAITGRNAANVNTEGYSREIIDLRSEPGVPKVGGVIANGPNRVSDDILAGRERQASGSLGNSESLSAALTGLEQRLAPQGNSLINAISSLFGGILDLSASPTSSALRLKTLSGARDVAASFQTSAHAIAQAQSDSDSRIVSLSQEATKLAAQIADDNHQLTTAINPDPAIQDQRDLAAKKLAEIVGGYSRVDPDGNMRFVVAGGVVLVDGSRPATVVATPDATLNNHVRLDIVDGVHVNTVTRTLDGGKIAGEINFRDGTAQQAAGNLDQLAFDLSTKINATHSTFADLTGVVGRNFFVPPGGVAGAAAAMAVDPTVNANPSFIAAAAPPPAGPGDNSGAKAFGALKDQLLAGGGTRTFTDEAIHDIGTVGIASATASNQLQIDQARTATLASVRNSLSGVSNHEELAKLAEFQHAAETATQFISTVNDMLTQMINKL